MDTSAFKPWMRAVILVGVMYFAVGFVFGLPSTHVRGWRLAAWMVSGAVYAAHIGYEHFWLNNSPRITALHAAASVAIGAFLLAVAATVHKSMVASQTPYWRFLLAMLVWPIITALPAFLVALVVSALLGCLPKKRLAE